MKKTFYSHGKLLISGEYLILRGALALAVPTKQGQRMEVEENENEENILFWKSYDNANNVWIDVQFNKKDLSPFRETLKNIEAPVLETLQKILIAIRKLNPEFLKNNGSTHLTNYLEFDRHSGLGSSSTVINNIAKYAGVDAFDLNKIIFSGSGYDIACANAKKPVLFRIDEEGPVNDTVHFMPPSPEKIFFVHLNKKQDSKTEVINFNNNTSKFTEEIEIISEITEALLFCDDFHDFKQLLDEHEELMQFVLQEEMVKTKLFPDFTGTVKSLGAWGGDFVLVASSMEEVEVRDYFEKKQYNTIIPYHEMVL